MTSTYKARLNADSVLTAKVVHLIGRESKIKDFAWRSQADLELNSHMNLVGEFLKKAKKLLGEDLVYVAVGSQEGTPESIETIGGLLDKVKAPKPGSAKDQLKKSLVAYIKKMKVLVEQVEKARKEADDESLDPCQYRAIEMIRSGKSLLMTGRPGSGKTYCALYALESLIGKGNTGNKFMLYVAPTSELVLQVYANFRQTFRNQRVGIVSPLITEVVKGASILVGTPVELWQYLFQEKAKWDVAIFDEIHTITLGQDKYFGPGYVTALRFLLSSTSTQVVALSATIHAEDLRTLRQYITESAGISGDVEHVELTYNPVVPHQYSLTSEGLVSGIVGGDDFTTITPKCLFTAFKQIGPQGGSLIFCEDDTSTWDLFSKLLLWLEDQNEAVYGPLISTLETIQQRVSEFSKLKEQLAELEYSSVGREDIKGTISSQLRILQHRTDSIHKTVAQCVADTIKKCVCEKSVWTVPLTSLDVERLRNLETETGQTLYPSTVVAGTRVHACVPYALLVVPNADQLMTVDSVGPYFSFIPPYQRTIINDFEALLKVSVKQKEDGSEIIKLDSTDQTEWSALNSLTMFAKAEGIPIKDIKDMVKVVVRSFRYGLALMMPSVPFVVTNIIRKFMNERRLPFICATQDLAIGINYSLKNVFILKTNPDSLPLPPEFVAQMAGRAGRRGMDKQANLVYANCCPDMALSRMQVDTNTQERVALTAFQPSTVETLLEFIVDRMTVLVEESKNGTEESSYEDIFTKINNSLVYPVMNNCTYLATVCKKSYQSSYKYKGSVNELQKSIVTLITVLLQLQNYNQNNNRDQAKEIQKILELLQVVKNNIIRQTYSSK